MDKKKAGAGLNLTRFINAKKSTYDPRIAKEKQRALNAKTVNKYKKLKQRLSEKLKPHVTFDKEPENDERDHQPEPAEGGRSVGEGVQPARLLSSKGRPLSQLQRLAGAKRAEEDALEKERKERQRVAEERRAKLAADAARRKAAAKVYRKKNARGQPVMKGRVDKLLCKIEAEFYE